MLDNFIEHVQSEFLSLKDIPHVTGGDSLSLGCDCVGFLSNYLSYFGVSVDLSYVPRGKVAFDVYRKFLKELGCVRVGFSSSQSYGCIVVVRYLSSGHLGITFDGVNMLSQTYKGVVLEPIPTNSYLYSFPI